MMNSIQISIEANEEQQEIIISELSELEAEGFEQSGDNLLAYFAEQNFKSYEVNEALKGYRFNISVLEEQNWNAVWESNFQPVVVSDFCAIRADFHEPIQNVEHEIVITPKMSFGTGHHATTYMMIERMKDMEFTGKSVFDFGTGTGILAILAEKLGAAKIKAIDIDEWSIINAKENVANNDCSLIDPDLSTEIPGEMFDIILANINRNVILDYLPVLYDALQQKAFILLSGLLTQDEKIVLEACEKQGLHFVSRSERGNWICLLLLNDYILKVNLT